jgi:hypothetical protein
MQYFIFRIEVIILYNLSLSQNPRKQPGTAETGDRKNERNPVRLECLKLPTQGDSRYENHNRNHWRIARASEYILRFAGCF